MRLAPVLWSGLVACSDAPGVPRCDEANGCGAVRTELDRLQRACWDDPDSEPRIMIPTPRMAWAGCCGHAAGALEARCGVDRETRPCLERWVAACPARYRR